MLYLVVVSVALTVGLVVVLIAQAAPAQPRVVRARLSELGLDQRAYRALQRKERRDQVDQMLQVIGEHLKARRKDDSRTSQMLLHAGYRSSAAPATYYGLKAALAFGLGTIGFLVGSAMATDVDMMFVRFTSGSTMLGTLYGGGIGWFLPWLEVKRRARARQKELQLALPDALDLLVICVEAGLGLNQALLRVAADIEHVSALMAEELGLVNFQIRAGTPRPEALANFGQRTGVSDITALTTMLIQTDRFGTSVAQSLRVHADTLRQKRRQRAEEAAAKTAIKMLFPLVLCIFPALFVVILGPAFIQITETLRGLF